MLIKSARERQTAMGMRTIEVKSVCLNAWADSASVAGVDYLKVEIERVEADIGTADTGLPAERLAAVEQRATAAYRRMIDGQARAVWRNRLARTVRTVVPKPLWSLSRRAAAALGLGGNPLVPNR